MIARNRLSRDGDGIAIENARGNLVALNVILDAQRAVSTSDSTSLRSAASTTSFAEMWSGGAARMGSLSEARTTTASSKAISQGGQGDDGFDVESSSTKLVRNRAVGNDDLGIEAVEGSSEGGGNRASGNGDPCQCVNVRCR